MPSLDIFLKLLYNIAKGGLVMKRKLFTILAAIASSALILTGCKEGENEVTQISEISAETTTANPYLLVRGWDGWELLESIYCCGSNRPLPLSLNENPDFSLSENILTFPDGSFAEAQTDNEGNVTALRFRQGSAPKDFSVYGVGFDARPDDIPDIIGIANSVVGGEDGPLVYSFYGGGITELTFIFEQRQLTEVYIAA